jgi:neuronal guanine nucleotide exchange factor
LFVVVCCFTFSITSIDCPQVQSIYDYNPQQPDELGLIRGDIVKVFRKMADGWYEGERLRDLQMGWFPSNFTVEIENAHTRARNLKERHRLLSTPINPDQY